ncbi:unnamed protein product [Brassicogethes aeneus]|uniref:Protein regulator of cytokinesis 1 n=1 Tax=Brassicogethes aeneus TaxID=1431903 RepID=A0A9P0AX35_BRAAE|nr:unnamed protein product [Brassicogethes aeneus]
MDNTSIMSFDYYEDFSFDLIKNVPWAQEMYEYLSQGLQKGFLNWCHYVIALSRDEKTIKLWAEEYKSEFEKYTCELITNIASVNSKVLSQVETLLSKLQKLCVELKIEMPHVGDNKLCLYEELDQLKKQIEEFEHMYRVRRDELNRIYAKQMEVCTSLGKAPKVFPKSPLLSLEEMENLQKHIDNLESEKYEREDDSNFMVTDSNMKDLEKFHNKLVHSKNCMLEEINEKWAKLDRLWTVLEVNVAERSNFSDANRGQPKEVLKSLDKEIKRLDHIKKDNIKVFIEKYRTELQALWDECHCDVNTRDFEYFNADSYTEDYLELFDMEIQRWKKYREENKALLKLLDEYNTVWKKLAELEEAAAGPNRFHNRGGKLLLEEKERNKFKRRIPQIQESLISMAEKYREKTGHEFMTWGKTVEQFIDTLVQEIEKEKKQKLSVRKQQRDQLTPGRSKSTLSLAKSSTQLFNTPSQIALTRKTPELPNKRKLITTPRTDVKKKPRVETKAPTSEYKRRPKVVCSKVVTSRRSIDKKNKSQKRLSNSFQKENNSIAGETSGYDQFEMEMTRRSNSRSTLHYEQQQPFTPVSRVTRKNPFPPTNVPAIRIQPDTPSMGTPLRNRVLSAKVLTPRMPKTPRAATAFSTAKNNNNMQVDF